tara:strand:+ start:1064 stop:2230 length:1167 start_codon:yes stop_codon:yes gene_type:complete
MAEKKEEVVEQSSEQTKVEETKVEETPVEEPKKDTGFQEDGTYKVDFNQQEENEKEKVDGKVNIEPVEEEKQEEIKEELVLEEVTNEEEQPETTEEVVEEEVEEKIEDKTPEVELPENIQKVVDFMNETGGTLEDYVRLNADYSNVDNEALLREYYKSTKPHLSSEEVNFMLEDNFSYNEETDEPRDVKRKKLAYKEAVAQAKNHLEGLKSKYYQEVKLGSRLAPEQQKAIDFFNRYNDEQVKVEELNAKQQKHFNKETDKVFNENFKGFDFQVGDKKYRYNVKDATQTREAQSDVVKAFSGFISKENLLQDAKGYHKALFAARNADALANHFYEQGKADAVKQMTSEAKNINVNRQTSDGQVKIGNQKMRVISGDNSSNQKFRLKNY